MHSARESSLQIQNLSFGLDEDGNMVISDEMLTRTAPF